MGRYKADVVIVGGGIAGIVVAIDLLSLGQRVLIVDRDSEANFGGLAKESFGGIWLVDTPQQRRSGIKDSPELALQNWLSFGDFEADGGIDDHPRRWAEAYVADCARDVYRFLKGHGIAFCRCRYGSSAGCTATATRYRAGMSCGEPAIAWRRG